MYQLADPSFVVRRPVFWPLGPEAAHRRVRWIFATKERGTRDTAPLFLVANVLSPFRKLKLKLALYRGATYCVAHFAAHGRLSAFGINNLRPKLELVLRRLGSDYEYLSYLVLSPSSCACSRVWQLSHCLSDSPAFPRLTRVPLDLSQ